MAGITSSRPMSIGDLSRRTGVKVETIRYYERLGIVPSPAGTPRGHRAYTHEALRRLGFVKRCRELGFGIDRIRDLLSLVADK